MSEIRLAASAAVPPGARAAVLVAHAGASARQSAVRLADLLHHHGLATLVADVLTAGEPEDDGPDTERIAHRVAMGLAWLESDRRTQGLPLGALAATRAASGLLVACAHAPDQVHAAVCVGGHPDRAGAALARVRTPVLLFAGALDAEGLGAARSAQKHLAVSELAVLDQTTSVVDEPGALYAAAYRIRDWFVEHLATEAH